MEPVKIIITTEGRVSPLELDTSPIYDGGFRSTTCLATENQDTSTIANGKEVTENEVDESTHKRPSPQSSHNHLKSGVKWSLKRNASADPGGSLERRKSTDFSTLISRRFSSPREINPKQRPPNSLPIPCPQQYSQCLDPPSAISQTAST